MVADDKERTMSVISAALAPGKIQAYDPIWAAIREETEAALRIEPALGGFLFATVLSHERLEEAVCHRLIQRLEPADVDAGLIGKMFQDVLLQHPEFGKMF